MLTIYNTTIHVKSQEQADRLKQVCVDYGLPIWDNFSLSERHIKTHFFRYMHGVFSTWHIVENSTTITESEWMELLTKYKNDENRN